MKGIIVETRDKIKLWDNKQGLSKYVGTYYINSFIL